MYQRHPIKIDKGRALSANNGPAVSSSTQVSFHKIYRKRRCYSIVDKEQERHSSSQWRSGAANTPGENNIGLQSNHTAGSSRLRTTRRVDARQSVKSSSHSAALSNIGNVNSRRQHVKRPNDRLPWNSASGPEFDVPVVKKQKADNYKPSALQHIVSSETRQGKQKIVLDDTKWMYKNQHARMSGPYGVKQLMEGFHARFLQEDLPIYQVLDGKLCQPIDLRQLVDDLHGCNALTHIPGKRSFSGQRLLQNPSKEMHSKIAKDADLPPGFGGLSVQLSEGPNYICMPSSTALAAAPKCSAGAFSSSVSDFGDADFSLPPGFEAVAATASLIEPHTTELSGSSRRLSTGAGVAVGSEDARSMYSSYGKLDPNVHNRGHSSQQVSSSHSKVSSTMQGAKILSENSGRHTARAYAPSNTRVSNFEAQTFSPPMVCIGLPVSKPAVQSWPAVNNLLSAVFKAEPYSFLDAHAQVSNGLVPKEESGFSLRNGPDPLTLIHLELLAAVKRTYVKSVLRAVIGEQLECWIDGRSAMCKSGVVEKGSLSRETRCLSGVEVGVMSVETPNRYIGSAESSLEATAAQCSDGNCLNKHSPHLGEYQCRSAEASSMRNTGNADTSIALVNASLPSNTEENGLDTSRIRKADDMPYDLEKAESCLSVDGDSKLSPKSSSSLGNDSKQVLLDLREEVQHQSVDKILHDDALEDKFLSSGNSSDAVLLEAEPPFLTPRKKKGNMKSLKQLMLITSKLRSRHFKKSMLMKEESKSLSTEGGETLERWRQDGVLIPKDYDGCARTSVDGWLWHNWARHAHSLESFPQRDCSTGFFATESLLSVQSNAQTARTNRAQLRKLAAAAKGYDILELTQSKLCNKKLKFARSKIHDWGVFAIEPVEAGDFVIEYIGELVRSRISDIRERFYERLGIGSRYLFRVDDETVVDATKRGGLARFIKHCCDPNCFTKIITVKGLKKIFIYAKRHIKAGEELTYDYSRKYHATVAVQSVGDL